MASDHSREMRPTETRREAQAMALVASAWTRFIRRASRSMRETKQQTVQARRRLDAATSGQSRDERNTRKGKRRHGVRARDMLAPLPPPCLAFLGTREQKKKSPGLRSDRSGGRTRGRGSEPRGGETNDAGGPQWVEERNEWKTLRWRKEIAVMTDATRRQGHGKARQAEGATEWESKLNSTYVVPGSAARQARSASDLLASRRRARR
ncbi:hypothetical protein PCL_00208 [Purpureocillium lilacinum]|uniref:Uncharacterized protein n=1 Tax=Purpureocillium lilacinum TaxID=33203 RepID=A0A2U3E6G6_PURLI|nr:hypothetical protein PCL_00208 [Purpureocillium lilacinum]